VPEDRLTALPLEWSGTEEKRERAGKRKGGMEKGGVEKEKRVKEELPRQAGGI